MKIEKVWSDYEKLQKGFRVYWLTDIWTCEEPLDEVYTINRKIQISLNLVIIDILFVTFIDYRENIIQISAL